METLQFYVPVVFILTMLASVWLFLRAMRAGRTSGLPANLFNFVLPFWMIFQAVLALGGFYQETKSVPPRLILFAILPALLFMTAYFVFFRSTFIERLPLKQLTILHVVRIPVEIVLLWLFQAGMIPQMMTFEGRNFDILSGALAVIVFLFAFYYVKRNVVRRWLLIVYNLVGLILLSNVVIIAAMSVPSTIQRLNFDQPAIAVLYFPYIWLPSIIVPIVLLAHLSSLWKLAKKPKLATNSHGQ